MTDRQRRQALSRRVARIARLMDSAVRIPVLGVRVGLDALLGLVPGLGDAVGVLVSAGYVTAAVRAGAPGIVLLRLLGNLGIDFALGFVPVLGDVFDIAWKANERNARLIAAWADAPDVQERRSRRAVVLVVAAVLALAAAAAAAGVALLVWLVGLATGRA